MGQNVPGPEPKEGLNWASCVLGRRHFATLRLKPLKTMVNQMSYLYSSSMVYFFLYHHLIFHRINQVDIMNGGHPAYGRDEAAMNLSIYS